ncbi:hypothetical protein CSKR_112615 [Clonorchis sinensis]|uniref:Uncharacterized protein n=2 Tax=Clonorchis sinensis TaxID=79923 RepID=A0A8T1MY34_CLOSI|nr:hypothetical protein CSKR_112615 [Clonorchis sinensis]GAA55492.1 hypothetical protein CLF_108157 [Clonorchis sinensis]
MCFFTPRDGHNHRYYEEDNEMTVVSTMLYARFVLQNIECRWRNIKGLAADSGCVRDVFDRAVPGFTGDRLGCGQATLFDKYWWFGYTPAFSTEVRFVVLLRLCAIDPDKSFAEMLICGLRRQIRSGKKHKRSSYDLSKSVGNLGGLFIEDLKFLYGRHLVLALYGSENSKALPPHASRNRSKPAAVFACLLTD